MSWRLNKFVRSFIFSSVYIGIKKTVISLVLIGRSALHAVLNFIICLWKRFQLFFISFISFNLSVNVKYDFSS